MTAIKDYGKFIFDLLPVFVVSGKVFAARNFNHQGWVISRGFFGFNTFIYSTEEFDEQLSAARHAKTKVIIEGKEIAKGQNGRTPLVYPLSIS